MHVAYVVATFPNPSETFVRREIDALLRQGFRVTVWALDHGEGMSVSPSQASNTPVTVLRPAAFSTEGLGSLGALFAVDPLRLVILLAFIGSVACRQLVLGMRLVRNVHTVAHFARCARIRRVDHIHGCFLNLPGVLAMGVSVVTGIPFSLAGHARDLFVESGPIGFLGRYAKWIILCNRTAAERLRIQVPSQLMRKVHVVHHGIDLDQWKPVATGRVADAPPHPLVVAVGRLVEKKGFDVLVESLARLRDRAIVFRALIIGSGPCRSRLETRIAQNRLSTCVRLVGWLDEESLRRVLQNATVLVAPSILADDGDQDGIPNILIEAAAIRVPIVVSDLPGPRELIHHGVNGILTPPGDDEALADAIDQLLRDPNLRRNLAANGRRIAERGFDLSRNARQIARLLASDTDARICR